MATPKEATVERDLRRRLADEGYSLQVTHWPRKLTYFNLKGEAFPNLPADPYSMVRYMDRGLTPGLPRTQPEAAVAEPEAERVVMDAGERGLPVARSEADYRENPEGGEHVDEIPCEVCGRKCKGRFGLHTHMRTHKEN